MGAEHDTTDDTQRWLVVITVEADGETARAAAEAAWDGLTRDDPPVVTVHRADGEGTPITVDLLCDDDLEPDRDGDSENPAEERTQA